MHKLALLLVASALLSSCGLGGKDDGGWTYDLPQGSVEPLDEALAESLSGDISGDISGGGGSEEQEAALEGTGSAALVRSGSQLDSSDAEALTPGLTEPEPSEEFVGEALPQRGPRPASPSLAQFGGQSSVLESGLDSNFESTFDSDFGRASRSHHRSTVIPPVAQPEIQSANQSPAALSAEPKTSVDELPHLQPSDGSDLRPATSAASETHPEEISGVAENENDLG